MKKYLITFFPISGFSLLAMAIVAYAVTIAFGVILINSEIPQTTGLLYPRESETREVRSLDGIWNFVQSDQYNVTQGIRERWYKDDLSKVGVQLKRKCPYLGSSHFQDRKVLIENCCVNFLGKKDNSNARSSKL